MNIKGAFVFAVVVTIVAGGAFAMSGGPELVSNSTIQLSCHLVQRAIQMPGGFDKDFCNALASFEKWL